MMKTAKELFKELEKIESDMADSLKGADEDNVNAAYHGVYEAMTALSNIWGAEVLRDNANNEYLAPFAGMQRLGNLDLGKKRA